MDHSTDPFTPRSPLSRELLERYASGLLSQEERHALEIRIEGDPLLRDALEGLEQPGALSALTDLHKPNFQSGAINWNSFLFPAVLILIGLGTWYFWPVNVPVQDAPRPIVQVREEVLSHVVPAAVESTLQVVHAEIGALPANTPKQAQHTTPERFDAPGAPTGIVKREIVERIATEPVTVEHDPAAVGPKSIRRTRPSRKLVFLHDLKVVHPLELYGVNSPVLPSPGVPANVGIGKDDAGAPSAQPYLDFLESSLGALADGNDRIALDDLYFLLGQYPADVNAQFYAGLACYRLGLYPRASKLLHAAAVNVVDSFAEEAVWYEALATDKEDGRQAARPALERIAAGGGFYAAQAKTLLGTK